MRYRSLTLRWEISWNPGWQHVDTTKPRHQWLYAMPEYEITREAGDVVYVVRKRWRERDLQLEETCEIPVDAVKFAVRATEPQQQVQTKGGRR